MRKREAHHDPRGYAFEGCDCDQCYAARNTVEDTLTKVHVVEDAIIKTDINSLPEDDTERNDIPMADGLLYYFPNALAEVARVSKLGNDQHNPGQPLHWARSKSTDHANKILRHLTDAGKKDSRGVRHSARLAWRALAMLQVELEQEEGAPRPRNAY